MTLIGAAETERGASAIVAEEVVEAIAPPVSVMFTVIVVAPSSA
jgi:hypothetical protein